MYAIVASPVVEEEKAGEYPVVVGRTQLCVCVRRGEKTHLCLYVVTNNPVKGRGGALVCICVRSRKLCVSVRNVSPWWVEKTYVVLYTLVASLVVRGEVAGVCLCPLHLP